MESAIFTKQVKGLLSDESYRELQLHVLMHPESDALIPGSGGFRKLRWRLAGRGKRGGARAAGTATTRFGGLTMRPEMFAELIESIKEMREIEAGRQKPARVTTLADLIDADLHDVAAIRNRYRLSQSKFAALLGISVDTLQNWEQRRRKPDGPARVPLRVAAAHPEALLSVASQPPKRARKKSKR